MFPASFWFGAGSPLMSLAKTVEEVAALGITSGGVSPPQKTSCDSQGWGRLREWGTVGASAHLSPSLT